MDGVARGGPGIAGVGGIAQVGVQPLQGSFEQRAINGFLAREPGVDGAGGAAGFLGDRADRRIFQAVALEHALGGIEDELAAQRVQAFIAAGAGGR